MAPSVFIEPLDFYTILVNFLLGSATLFAFAFVIAISVLSAKFNMPPKIFGVVTIVGAIILGSFLGISVLLLLGVIIAIFVYSVVRRMVQY